MTLKEQAIANLRDLHAAAERIGLRWCLLDGTLLGAVRDGDLCPGDEDDIDIGVMDADYDRTPELVAELLPLGFTQYKPLVFRGRVEGFGLGRGGSHFDVIRVNHHPRRAECYNLGRIVRKGIMRFMAFVYPDKHHKSFGEIELYGMRLNTPADPEGFLTARYGDWRTPIPRPEFVWYEQANRDSIREDYDIL